MNFLYLLKGAPAVPTSRSNRCFAVATRTLLRLSRCESSSLRSSGNLTATRQVHFSRLDNKPSSACLASAETTGCVQDASYGCESKLPLARLSVPSVAQFAQYTSARFSCRAPEFCDDCADTCCIMMPPMHSGLFASPRDNDSRRSFNMTR